MEMVDEYGEDNGDDDRGEKAHETNAVEGQRWIVGRFDGGSRPHCELVDVCVSFGSVGCPRDVWEGRMYYVSSPQCPVVLCPGDEGGCKV
jgi:hypothetical protein